MTTVCGSQRHGEALCVTLAGLFPLPRPCTHAGLEPLATAKLLAGMQVRSGWLGFPARGR